MGIPYALLKVFQGEEPYLDKSSRDPKQQAEFLMKDKHMKGKYLGECLDSCRWGSQRTVMYEMNVKDLINFIQNWMQQNDGIFEYLWHERKIEELYTKFELPFIHHEACPIDKNHSGVVRDMGGRIRCSNSSEGKFRPSFLNQWNYFDKDYGMERNHFYEKDPDPLPDSAWDEETGDLLEGYEEEWEQYVANTKRFESEKPSLVVKDVCYTIISDRGRILPLETILKRLNLLPEKETFYCDRLQSYERVDEIPKDERKRCKRKFFCDGHVLPYGRIEFPFDGWDLAFYAQKWHEQVPNGKAPITEEDCLIINAPLTQ